MNGCLFAEGEETRGSVCITKIYNNCCFFGEKKLFSREKQAFPAAFSLKTP